MINVLLIAGLLIVGLYAADGSLIGWVIDKFYQIKGWAAYKHE
jgi:hypothetical protein